MTEALGGLLRGKRKFTVALLALFGTFYLALPHVGVIDGGNWVMAVSLVTGLYSFTEASEGVGHALAARRPPEGP